VKLINSAIKLFAGIFCLRSGTERNTKMMGQIMLRGCATCPGRRLYAFRRIM
jgi:hypothetical protein